MQSGDGLQVLLVAPTGRDAGLIEEALGVTGLHKRGVEGCRQCGRVYQARDVGALLVAEEAWKASNCPSRFGPSRPAGMVCRPCFNFDDGRESDNSESAREQRLLMLGGTTLLERPIRVATLRSSVKSALHDRIRQYERKLAEAALRQTKNWPPWADCLQHCP